ncbi:tetratricopeptide repeat protein [Chitinophaga rhizophila]|uniref:Tetratricopeptide repeat protein n=1 Tax=Chitinophaga rhizophila TaxID=2866212 RepID=A0ABS7GJX1_9BACT|nr:tetratricopeptide repeat protein [Chitinophaga rhizophila]MBW8687993.1 tetratricopeptide repeat protein [Chitinophaga rhizophila]
MKSLLVAFFLSFFCFFGNTVSAQLLTDKEAVEKRFLVNGAYRYHYFAPQWQLYLDSALAILPGEASFWQLKAMPLFKQRKYEAGMKYLDKAVALDPAEYLDYRAFIKCIFQKDYQSAITDFNLAKSAHYHQGVMDHGYDFYLGLSYLQLNDYSAAKASLLEVIRRVQESSPSAPVHFLYYFYLGIVHYETADYPAAVDYFNKALSLYPRFSDAGYYKSICLMRLHRDEEGRKTLAAARKDFKEGYSIPEDNAVYEPYPYQVKDWMYTYYKQ